VAIKDMESGEQRAVARGELVEFVKSLARKSV